MLTRLLAFIQATINQIAFILVFFGGGYIALNAMTQGPQKNGEFVTHSLPRAPSDVRVLYKAGRAADLIRAVQRELRAKGYVPGRENGEMSAQSRAAIMAFQHDTHQVVTGAVSEALLQSLILGSSIGSAGRAGRPPRISTQEFNQTHRLIQNIEEALAGLGYMPGPIDGKIDQRAAQAIKQFEHDRDLPSTGRVSGRLVTELSQTTGQPLL